MVSRSEILSDYELWLAAPRSRSLRSMSSRRLTLAFRVPLMRVSRSHVAAWWPVPRDAEGNAKFTHPSVVPASA